MDDQRLARSAMIKDYYAILGVTQTATQEEIRTAYRQLVLKYHPDVSTAPDAEEHFKEINESYAMLAEPEKRKVYDIFLTMIANGMGKFATGQQQPESQAQPASQTAPPYPNQPGAQQPPPPGYQQHPAYQQPSNMPPQNPSYPNPYQPQQQSGYQYPPYMPPQQPYQQPPPYYPPQPGPGYPYQAPYPSQQQNPYLPNNQGPYPAPYPNPVQQPPYPPPYQQPQTGPYPGQQPQPTGYPYAQPAASGYPYQVTPEPQQPPASPYGTAPTPAGYNTQPSPPQSPTYPPSQPNQGYQQPASGQPYQHPEKEQKKKAPRGSRYFPPTWALLLILLGFLIVVAVGISALLSMQRDRPTGGSEALTVSKLPTFISPPEIPSEPVIQGNGVPVTSIVPENLSIGVNKSVSIVPVIPEEGRWPIPAEDGNVAVWVYGTVINYVIGMPYSDTTESTLAGLSSADRLTMTLSNGNQLVFGSPQAQRITADDTTPMIQQKPGLTLVLLGGSQTNRLIVQARYLPEESPAAENEQRIEGVAFKVLGSRAVEADGNNYFVIEYQTTNNSANPADPGLFDLVLEDGDGQRYTPNQAATAQGSAGPLTTPIPVGGTATGSVGYKVPASMRTPLTWRVKVDPTSTTMGTFILPYEPPPLTPAQPDVELTTAFVDPDRNVIVVEGTLRNLGETALNVTLDSLKLSSSVGSSSLQASTPLLPWKVDGKGEQSFELQFSLPQGTDSVLLDVFGYTFEIDGL